MEVGEAVVGEAVVEVGEAVVEVGEVVGLRVPARAESSVRMSQRLVR